MKYSLAAAGLFALILPLSASAQASVSQSSASPQGGITTYGGGGFHVNGTHATDEFGHDLTQLILNDLNAYHISTGHDNADINFDAVYDDATTMNRVCRLTDSSARETAYDDEGYSSEGSGGHGPGNDEWIVKWTGSGWSGYDAKSNDNHINYLECTSYALPSNTLTASDYSVAPGAAVKLTLTDNADLDTLSDTSCSSTGFTLPKTTTESVCIGGYEMVCNGIQALNTSSGQSQAAAASVALGNGTCARQCIGGYHSVTRYPAQSGTVTVNPTTTTTYKYSCTSPNGTTVASAKVTVTAPNQAPAAPTLAGLYNNTGSTNYGSTVASRNQSGYREYAKAVDPDGDSVNYLFYFEKSDGTLITKAWSGYTGSGGWGYYNDFVDLPPGPYIVGAYAYDGALYSPFSGWQSITMTAAPIAASCSASPTTGKQGDPITWTATASGGDTDSAYSYVWSGTDGLTGSTASVVKRYDTTGTQTASVKVTDADGTSVTKACSNSVSISSCTAVFSQSSQTIQQGDSATLTWGPSGSCSYSSCTFTDGPSYSGGSGTRTVTPAQTSTYGISCKGIYVPSTPVAQATVNVIVPTVDIKANGQDSNVRVQSGGNASISWTSANATSCSVTKNGASWQSGLSSAGTSDTVNVVTKYTADCVNAFGTHVTDSVTVDITPTFNEY